MIAVATVAFILACALAGGGLGAALFMRCPGHGRVLFGFMVGELLGAALGAHLGPSVLR